jgi:hypothetical protein
MRLRGSLSVLVPRIDAILDYVSGQAKNKIFAWHFCCSISHAFAGGVKAINGFQPNCIAVAKGTPENVILGGTHVLMLRTRC